MSGARLRFARALWAEQRALLVRLALASAMLMATEGIGLLMLVPLLRLAGVPLGVGDADRMAVALDALLQRAAIAPSLAGVLVSVVLIVSARAVVQYAKARWGARLEASVVGRLRERLFGAIVATPWAQFVGERPAALVHAVGPQVDDVHSSVLMLLEMASSVAAAVAALVVALVISPPLTAVVLAAAAAVYVVARLLRAPGRRDGEQLLSASSGLFARLSELIGGMKMLHAHGAEREAVQAVAADTHAWAALSRRTAERQARVSFVLAVVSVVMLAVVVWSAVEVVALSPATLLLLLLLYARLVSRVSELQALSSGLARNLASFDAVTALLERCDAARRAEDREALNTARRDARDAATTTPPAIELRGVTVRYATARADEAALRAWSGHFAAGALTAVVGASGAGKTTLADLLLRLLEPAEGDVLVDGQPLAARTREEWRAHVAYLAQDPMLFHGTLRENLRLARPDVSDEAMQAALRAAACDFVFAMPQGLDTPIGDRGVLLSGGERQRLALARALVREPLLLVLDEATSALDAATEARILDALRALRGRCTMVFCTHRDAVREAADFVVTL